MVCLILSLDKLDGDAYTVPTSGERRLEKIVRVQFFTDLFRGQIGAFVLCNPNCGLPR